MTKCNCAECRKQREEERSLPEKIVRTAANVAAGYAIGTAVTAVTGSPVAGVIAAKAITGVSGPEDLL